MPPLPPPPLKGCDDSYDPRIAKDNDVCVAGAIGGAAPLVTFWGEGEDVTGLSRPPRLAWSAEVVRSGVLAGPCRGVLLEEPYLRRLPQEILYRVIEFQGLIDAMGSVSLCNWALRNAAQELRNDWKLEPLTATELKNAKDCLPNMRAGKTANWQYQQVNRTVAPAGVIEVKRLQKSLELNQNTSYALREIEEKRKNFLERGGDLDKMDMVQEAVEGTGPLKET